MKVDFKFSNLLGPVYVGGNILFTSDGSSLLTPVGNRISQYNLQQNKVSTFAYENRNHISRIAMSEDGSLILSADKNGHGELVKMPQEIVLARINFKDKVTCAKFSPNGRFIVIGVGRILEVWRVDSMNAMVFTGLSKVKQIARSGSAAFTCIDFTSDSSHVVVGSKDNTVRLISLKSLDKYIQGDAKNSNEGKKEKGGKKRHIITFQGHTDAIVGCFFMKNENSILSVSKNRKVCKWTPYPEDSHLPLALRRWTLSTKEYTNLVGSYRHYLISTADFNRANNLLVVGFENGVFGLYETDPAVVNIHTLSISHNRVNSVAINPKGDWLAFACKGEGQLLVWDWRAENYILKQQGHGREMNCMAYSNDAKYIATGGLDGKIKVWNAQTGNCFVTFPQHTGSVTALTFNRPPDSKDPAIFSASSDGTCRGFDLLRYRHFRTYVAPKPVQFSCLAVDPSGEILVASGNAADDNFDIYVWNVRTGDLMDVLSGHQSTISSLKFNPTTSILASGSWDKTVRLWDVFSSKGNIETLDHNSDVVALAWRPDGNELCAATLNGSLVFWDTENAKQTGSIEGRRDIPAGRRITDMFSDKKNWSRRFFSCIDYSSDGSCIVAGGQSKYVCLYSVAQQALLRRFTVSNNTALDGVIDSKQGVVDIIDDPSDDVDDNDGLSRRKMIQNSDQMIPGAARGDFSERKTIPEIRTRAVAFSPTNRDFCAVTTEGLAIFSLDTKDKFEPIDLDPSITPLAVLEQLKQGNYSTALIMALRLNEQDIVSKVFNETPATSIKVVVASLPANYVSRFIDFLVLELEDNVNLEFCMQWCNAVLTIHGRYIMQNKDQLQSSIRDIQRSILRYHEDIAKLCEENKYSLDYLSSSKKARITFNNSNGNSDIEFNNEAVEKFNANNNNNNGSMMENADGANQDDYNVTEGWN